MMRRGLAAAAPAEIAAESEIPQLNEIDLMEGRVEPLHSREVTALSTVDSPVVFAVKSLLLPINYGVLIVDKALPRVTAVGERPMTGGDEAWLVWEGKDGATYLIRDRNRTRSLLTLRGEIKQTEIVGFDRILPTLFMGPNQAGLVQSR